jgi:hypothetical protein
MHAELATCIRELLEIRAPGPHKPAHSRRDQLYPVLNDLPPANMRRHFPFLGKDELLRLTDDLNSIRDEGQIARIDGLTVKGGFVVELGSFSEGRD